MQGLIAKLRESDSVRSADLLGDDQLVEYTNSLAGPVDPRAKRFVIDIRMVQPQ